MQQHKCAQSHKIQFIFTFAAVKSIQLGSTYLYSPVNRCDLKCEFSSLAPAGCPTRFTEERGQADRSSRGATTLFLSEYKKVNLDECASPLCSVVANGGSVRLTFISCDDQKYKLVCYYGNPHGTVPRKWQICKLTKCQTRPIVMIMTMVMALAIVTQNQIDHYS